MVAEILVGVSQKLLVALDHCVQDDRAVLGIDTSIREDDYVGIGGVSRASPDGVQPVDDGRLGVAHALQRPQRAQPVLGDRPGYDQRAANEDHVRREGVLVADLSRGASDGQLRLALDQQHLGG